MQQTAPAQFQKQLADRFGGRLRIRWSPRRGEWHIEQKSARAKVVAVFDEGNDRHIRSRDGYAFVMALRPGPHVDCPTCGRLLKAPIRATAEVICPACQATGNKDARVMASYYPLDDSLLEYLHFISPECDGAKRAARDQDRSLELREQTLERDTQNTTHAGLKEDWKHMVGIQSVGYTGRSFAPET